MALIRVIGEHPVTKGAASLFVALGFATLPLTVDAIRARRSAAPIRVTASPSNVPDSTPRCRLADTATQTAVSPVGCSR
jgi:hypothetical protein